MTEWSTVSAMLNPPIPVLAPEVPTAAIPAVAAPTLDVECRNRRVFGGIIDMCILPIVLLPVIAVMVWLFPHYHGTAYIGWVLCAPVVACFLSSRFQATPGMMLLGVIARTIEGERLGFFRAFLRHILSIVPLSLLGYILWNFNKKRQAFHDIAVRSIVVRKPKDFSTEKGPWLLLSALFIPSIALSVFLLGFTPIGQAMTATDDNSSGSVAASAPSPSSASATADAAPAPAPAPPANPPPDTAVATPAAAPAPETSTPSDASQPPNDDNVSTVKNGTLEFDNTVKIGPALEGCSFLKNVAWKSFETDQGRKIVEADASVNLDAYKNTDLGDGSKLPPEWVDGAEKAMPGLQVTYSAQFELSQTDNGITVGYSGYTVKGRASDTGKPFEQDIKDTDDSKSIKSVFANTPDPQVAALIVALSQSKPQATSPQPSP